MGCSICIVAIAKNEGKFIKEWLSHYLALGATHIHVYDNDSTDDTAEILVRVGRAFPVTFESWPNPRDASPQITCYRTFLEQKASEFDWVAFFDVDEFLVLKQGQSFLPSVLETYDSDVAAIGVNWLTFGSSGIKSSSYELVTQTFSSGPERTFGNNKHFKTILRPAKVSDIRIHHCTLSSGRYIHPNGSDLTMPKKDGLSGSIEHSVMQLNHYQVKSEEDFWAKMERGRVSKKAGDIHKYREDPQIFKSKLDQNVSQYGHVEFNSAEFSRYYQIIKGM